MRKSNILGGLLLTTALNAPAFAQSDGAALQDQDQPEQEIEVSVPGAGPVGPDIVITGTRQRNIVRQTPQVVALLSNEDIARTGEGDIAGALSRVTGLSVVGNGFVFVRGLGDRYSLALLNGSPLPSPEPLRRVVPLDIFPTSVIASSLVQKSYSVNYPGEFGGGVINLTTPAVPRESFLTIGAGVSGDTETSFNLGYTYYGGDLDWLGYDDGTRRFPAGLRDAVAAGNFNSGTTGAQRRDFAASLTNAATTVLQRNRNIPANFSGDISAGTSFDIGGARIGLIAAAGYDNSWRTRDALQQSSLDPELDGGPFTSFRRVSTDNRVLVNGLAGIGADFGGHRLRWTNLYIHDTLKQGRLGAGFNRNVNDQDPNLPPSLLVQNTYWFERQLFDTQFVGEFRFGNLSVDLRGTYANTRRESPYERSISYAYLGDGDPSTVGPGDVDDYINNLTSAGQSASITFSDLSEDIYAGGADFVYRLPVSMPVTLSAGYAYTDTQRSASRYQFQYFRPEGALPLEIAQQRPDYLLSDFNIYTFNIQLRDVSGAEGAAAYEADLRIHAGYAQAEIEPVAGLRANFGVRYEDAVQSVLPIGSTISPTQLSNSYWLPAATLTWEFMPSMQLRLHGSKTIARPQFRELAPQLYQDFESDREYTGNPFLVDSELLNFEGRWEYYMRSNQRVSLAGFWKRIDNPIETVAFFASGQNQFRAGFANAPRAELYGAEAEVQLYFPLDRLGGGFLSTRRLLLIGNYTYTQSSITSGDSVVVGPNLQPVPANVLFRDGAPLTGQSDHIANLQIGIEDTDSLSQATFLLSYASERVTTRGPIQGQLRQPDIIERPGFQLDFVLRQEVPLFRSRVEFKFEARNILGQYYEEYQEFGENRIDVNTYRRGRRFSLGATITF
jgi:outer membrane receptor protein involved in Fe transport